MRVSIRFVSLAAISAVIATVPGSAQKTTGPKATYAMDVSTMSGMGMGAMMGGGLGSLLGGGGGDNSGPDPGGDGAGGYVIIDYLPDYEGSTNTNYTSLNSTHKLIMRMAQAFIQVTEYRN